MVGPAERERPTGKSTGDGKKEGIPDEPQTPCKQRSSWGGWGFLNFRMRIPVLLRSAADISRMARAEAKFMRRVLPVRAAPRVSAPVVSVKRCVGDRLRPRLRDQ